MTGSVKLADIHSDLVPHPTQQQVLEDPTRFKVVVTGRRWGKSQFALIAAVNHIISHPEASVIWIVSPTLDDVRQLWTRAIRYLRKVANPAFESPFSPEGKLVTGALRDRYDCRLFFYNRSRIYFKAGECLTFFHDEDEIPSLLIVDEADLLPEHAWRVLWVWVMDEVETAIFLSTPANKNDLRDFFHQMYLAGSEKRRVLCCACGSIFKINPKECIFETPKCDDGIFEIENDKKKKNYKTFNFSSYNNPFVPREELDELVEETLNPLRDVYGCFA